MAAAGYRREPGDDRGGVHQPALGQADNSLHFRFSMSTGMTVRTGPTPGGSCCVSAGFDRDDIGADRAHAQCRGDPCLDVCRVHGTVEQQDVDQFTGSRRRRR